MGRPLHNPPIAGAAWPTLLARPGHLFLALIITILSALPAAAQSTPVVNEPHIVVPTSTGIWLSQLIEANIVTDVPGDPYNDYVLTSSNSSSDIFIYRTRVTVWSPLTTSITYTHKESPEISFTIDFEVKQGASASQLAKEIGTIYLDHSKMVVVDSEVPIKNGSFRLNKSGLDNPADAKLEQDGNTLTLTGVAEGQMTLEWDYDPVGVGRVAIDIAKKPSKEDIIVHEKSIVVPTNSDIRISTLIESGVVSGAIGSDEDWIISSSNPDFYVNNNYNYFRSNNPGTSTITYTNKDFNEVSFPIEVTAKMSPADYIYHNLSTVYLNESKPITIPEDCIPLGEFTITKVESNDYYTGDFDFEIIGNDITITGKAEGKRLLSFEHKYGITSVIITIAKKPSKEDIVISEKSITVPTSTDILLSTLIESGVVSGAGGSDEDWIISSSNSDFYLNNTNNRFWANNPGTSTITYTNKDFKEVSFSIEVTAKMSPADYVYQNLGTVYLNESKPITIPDDCISLGEFTITKGVRNDYYTGDFDYVIGGNDLTITGKVEGNGLLRFEHKYGIASVVITIAKKPSKEDINVLKPSIVVPTNSWIYLNKLIEDKVVDGVSGRDADYAITSTNTENVQCDDDGSFIFRSAGSGIFTFTHKDFPDVTFDLEVTAKMTPATYINQSLGTIYIGDSREITIPEDYIPIDEFTLTKGQYSDYPDADFDFEVNGNVLTITGKAEGKKPLLFQHKYGTTNAQITIAKKPSNEDIIVHEKSITIPTSASIYLSKLIESGIVSGVSGSDNDWIITSSNPDFYVYPTEYNSNHFSAYIIGSSTITYTHKDFKEVSFSIEVTSKMSPADYIGRNLRAVYINESNSLTIPDDCIPLDDYTEIVKDNFTWTAYPNADFDVKHDGNKLTITGLGEGKRGLRFNHKVYGWASATINIEKKPDVADIQTPGSGLALPLGYGLNLWMLTNYGLVTGITGTQYKDYTISSSDDNIISPSNENTTAISRSTGEATLTFTHKDFEDVKFDFVVNVKKGIDESVMAQLPNNTVLFVDVPRIITVDSEIPLSDYEITLFDNNGKLDNLDISIDGNNIVLTGIKKTLTSARVYFMYKPLQTGFTRSVRIVEAETVTPEVDAEGNGQSETWLDTPVKVNIPAEIADKIEDGQTVVWKSDNEGVATVNENGIVNPLKPGKTVITASVENGTSRAAATLMSIDFWVTDVEINCPTTFEVGDTYKVTFKVIPEDYPNEIKYSWWLSYDRSIIDIDDDGNLKAVGPGTTSILGYCSVGYNEISVTVTGGSVTEINLDTEKISGVEGTTYHLQADVDDLTWSSSDESVAVVDQNGIVTLVGAGRAIITATAPNGVKATCEVVVEAASGIDGVEADTETAFAPVYDLTGRLVARTPEQMAALRAGIYIQAGRKIYISK